MRAVQQGDRIQVHYVKRFEDGTVISSRQRGHAPLELVVGVKHPRLPELGVKLIGMTPGNRLTLFVPAEQAHGIHDAGRILRLSPTRFTGAQRLMVGKWVRIPDRRGRRRLVRIVQAHDRAIIVDANHPKAGQAMEFEVELVGIYSERQASATN